MSHQHLDLYQPKNRPVVDKALRGDGCPLAAELVGMTKTEILHALKQATTERIFVPHMPGDYESSGTSYNPKLVLTEQPEPGKDRFVLTRVSNGGDLGELTIVFDARNSRATAQNFKCENVGDSW